ncbi:hypothetical protein [Sphingomonas sp.]|uniref:hypothetical protein n=1 Tax=Sphingomonas sp. TaxID=28214 RepID=UPI003B3B42E6
MAAPDESLRVYGQPDGEDDQAVPEEGLRGEQGAPARLREDLSHDVKGADGSPITLQEQSGVAFAEASGAADGQDPDPA